MAGLAITTCRLNPRGLPRISFLGFAVVLFVVLASACGVSSVEVPWPNPESGPAASQIDSSIDIASAFIITADEIAANTTFSDTLAPRFDDDFWRITVIEPGQLVTVSVEFMRTASPIKLAFDWIGPRDLCMPASPTACSHTTDCSPPQSSCDVPRHGCRSA